jgi:hypothetical protein
MVVRSIVVISCFSLAIGAQARAQDPNAQGMPNPQAMQLQVQQIMQNRPREAEAAARAFLGLILQNPGDYPVQPSLAGLDSLKNTNLDAYWGEVAQLTVQFQVVQTLVRRDSLRADFVMQLFALEARMRAVQRVYRNASESQRRELREELEAQMTAHFDIETNLRSLEVADITRRLAEINAETQRRREKRAEFIKFAVDDIVRDAIRPR